MATASRRAAGEGFCRLRGLPRLHSHDQYIDLQGDGHGQRASAEGESLTKPKKCWLIFLVPASSRAPKFSRSDWESEESGFLVGCCLGVGPSSRHVSKVAAFLTALEVGRDVAAVLGRECSLTGSEVAEFMKRRGGCCRQC